MANGALATGYSGDTIRETLEIMDMSQTELAERMGRAKEKVNDIIKGRAPISPNTAFQLEKVLGIPASFWLNREHEYKTYRKLLQTLLDFWMQFQDQYEQDREMIANRLKKRSGN